MTHGRARRVVKARPTTVATFRDTCPNSLLTLSLGVRHEASLSRMTSDKVTPRLRASRSRRWTTGSDTTTPRRRTSPVGLITRGLAITTNLIGGCCPVGECRHNRPHLYPVDRLRGRENESLSEVLRASSPESASGRCLCRRGLRESLGQLVEGRREQTTERLHLGLCSLTESPLRLEGRLQLSETRRVGR